VKRLAVIVLFAVAACSRPPPPEAKPTEPDSATSASAPPAQSAPPARTSNPPRAVIPPTSKSAGTLAHKLVFLDPVARGRADAVLEELRGIYERNFQSSPVAIEIAGPPTRVRHMSVHARQEKLRDSFLSWELYAAEGPIAGEARDQVFVGTAGILYFADGVDETLADITRMREEVERKRDGSIPNALGWDVCLLIASHAEPVLAPFAAKPFQTVSAWSTESDLFRRLSLGVVASEYGRGCAQP
jgi:hypothetical protein